MLQALNARYNYYVFEVDYRKASTKQSALMVGKGFEVWLPKTQFYAWLEGTKKYIALPYWLADKSGLLDKAHVEIYSGMELFYKLKMLGRPLPRTHGQ